MLPNAFAQNSSRTFNPLPEQSLALSLSFFFSAPKHCQVCVLFKCLSYTLESASRKMRKNGDPRALSRSAQLPTESEGVSADVLVEQVLKKAQ
jgi:hypothetical protein